MKKEVLLLLMLLVGLLVPMTIASKSLDFDLTTVMFSDLEDCIIAESMQPIKTKSISIQEEVTIQYIRFSENQAAIAVGQSIFIDSSLGYVIPDFYKQDNIQQDKVHGDLQVCSNYKVTNYIRYL